MYVVDSDLTDQHVKTRTSVAHAVAGDAHTSLVHEVRIYIYITIYVFACTPMS